MLWPKHKKSSLFGDTPTGGITSWDWSQTGLVGPKCFFFCKFNLQVFVVDVSSTPMESNEFICYMKHYHICS